MRSSWLPAAFALFLVACHAGGPPPGTACNGHDELCARTYDAVAFAGTHNAASNIADHFGAPDQSNGLVQQLDDGIRVLHLEMQAFKGDVYLCHSVCPIGNRLLVDDLKLVAGWVKAHPRDVVTLLMESNNVTSDDLVAHLKTAGLGGYLHTQAMGTPWPTLGTLIDHGDRVVAFWADQSGTGGARFPFLLDRFAWTWETPWDNETYADFTRCNADRGTAGNSLYVVDTYLEEQIIPSASDAARVNYNPFLAERLLHCRDVSGVLPNFVMVNFYEVSDVFADVDVLNGLATVPANVDLDMFPPPDDGGSANPGTTPSDASP